MLLIRILIPNSWSRDRFPINRCDYVYHSRFKIIAERYFMIICRLLKNSFTLINWPFCILYLNIISLYESSGYDLQNSLSSFLILFFEYGAFLWRQAFFSAITPDMLSKIWIYKWGFLIAEEFPFSTPSLIFLSRRWRLIYFLSLRSLVLL